LDKQQEQDSDTAWINLSAAAKHHRGDEDKTQIESEIVQHVVDESHFNCKPVLLLHQYSDHIHKLRNILNER
jgi:hypothetical protein